jgi:hypothetical protein
MSCYYIQYRCDSAFFWIFPQVNSSVFALRATPGQEGWRLFCHVVYPCGKAGEFQILRC